MPRYAQLADGRTLEFPDNTTNEVIQRTVRNVLSQTAQPVQPVQPELEKSPIEDVLEEIPLVGDFLTGTADVGLGAIQGLAGVTGAATEAFGADNRVSRFFEDIAQGAQALMSAEERGDLAEGQRIMQEAEDKGILEQVKAAARAFSKSPLTLAAQAAGSALPFVAATIATGGGAAVPLGLGALTGAGVVKGSVYDTVEAEALKEGLTQEQAAAMADAAQAYGGENLDMIALGTVLGGVAGRLGIEGAFAKSIGNKIARGAIGTATAEATTEAAQAGQERLAGNLAAQRAGYDVPLGRGVAGQATLEGIMGGVPGAAVGAIKGRAEATAEEIEEAQKLYREAVAAKTETVEDEEGRAYIEAETARLVNEIGYDPENAASVAADQWATIQRAREARAEREADVTDTVDDTGAAEQLELPFGRGVESSVSTPSGGPPVESETPGQLELPFGRRMDAGGPDVSVNTGRGGEAEPTLAPQTPEETITVAKGQKKVAERAVTLTPLVTAELDNVIGAAGDKIKGLGEEKRQAVIQNAATIFGRQINNTRRKTPITPALAVEQALKNNNISIPAPVVETAPEMAAPAPVAQEPVVEEAAPEPVTEQPAPVEAVPEPVVEEPVVEELAPEPEPEPVVEEPVVEAAPEVVPEQPATEQAAPLTEENVASSTTWYDGGSKTAVVGGKKPAWVPDDTLLYGSYIGEGERTTVPTEDESQIILDPFRAKDGAIGTRLSVQVPSPDRTYGDRGNFAEFSFWLRNTKKEDINVGAVADTAKTIVRRIAEINKNNSPTTVPQELENLNRIADRAIKYIVEQAAPEPATEQPAVEEAAPAPAPVTEEPAVEEPVVEAAPEPEPVVEEPVEEPAPAPEPAPVIEDITDEERATAEGLAGDVGGIVAFITRSAPGEAAIGLLRGTSVLSGRPVYMPFKGGLRYEIDVDSDNINPESAGLTQEELALLRQAKRDIEAEDAAKHKNDPFVKYDADGLAFSSSVPEALRNIIRGWKKLLLPDVKIYITDTADIVIDKYKYTGVHRKIQSAAMDPGEEGSTRRIDPGEHYIAVALTSLAGDTQAILETVAHEIGHIHDKESFQNASPEIQQKLRQEHQKWLTKNTAKDKTATDLVKALRAPAMGKRTEMPDIPASQLSAYWQSFSEWYADQMSRWATSSEKPLSVVDKFFKSVVDKLRAFYRTVRGQGYLPNETFKQFVENTTANLDLSDTSVAEETDVVKAADAALMAEQISLDDFEAIQTAAESGKFNNKQLFRELDRRKKQFLNRPSFAKTTAAKATVDAAKKADEALEKVRAAGDRDSKELPRKMQSAFREQKLRNQIRSLPFVGAVASDSSFRVLLGSLPTTGLLNYADTMLGKQITANLRRAMNFVERMYADRLRMMRRLSIPVKQLFEHQKKFGNIVMSDAMNYARATNIDMTAFKPGMSEQQAFNTDLVLRYLENLIKDPDNATRKRLGQIELRKQQLRRAMMLWDALGKQGNGQKIYADIRNMYRNLYQVRRNALERSLKSWGVPGANRILKQMQLELEKIDERIKPPAEGEGHPQYPDVPLGLFPREYFPYKRFGNYYVRVEKGPAGEPATYFAENEQKRDAKAAELIAQGYAISSRGLVSEDYNVRDDLAGSAVFEKAVTIINQLDPEKTTQATKDSLNEELYNLYLMTLPDAVRQRFIKSKNRTGYSSDVARVAATTATEYANEIAKLDYRNQINASISQARDAAEKLEGEEGLTPTQEDNLKAFAAEVEARANNTISPTSTNNAITKGIRGATQLAFMAFLTAPATALVNTTALPVRVQPRLWREYKFNDVNNMLTKYATTWRVLPKLRQTDSGSALQHVPSVADNPMVKNNPVLLRAYNRANNRYSLFEGMASVIMENEPTPDVVGDRLNTAKRVASNAATYLFDVSEKLSRETAYMTAFELEYNKLKKEGKLDQLEIEEAATEKAKDIVYDTLFNYNAYNRPRFANQSELAKAVFQFKMYAVETMRFLVESSKAVIRGQRGLDGPTRLQAFKELAGVFLMAGMFGGLANSFLSLPIVALALLASGIGDDEDDEISSLLKDYDMDAWFANEYLPEHLSGPAFEGADGESYSVADLVLRGPLSVATGMNFGSRVNLDPRTLLIHTQVQGDTTSEKVQNAIIDNIPGASAGFDVMAAFDDIAKGEVLDGVVKGLPLALVRQPLKAYRFGTKGYISSSGKEKLSRDDLETYQLMGVAFGLNPLELAQLQEKQSVQFGIKDEYGGARSELMGRLNKTRRMVASGTKSSDDLQEIYADIREHNEEMRRIGAYPYLISGEDIARSLRSLISEGRYDIDGMSLNRDEALMMSRIFPRK